MVVGFEENFLESRGLKMSEANARGSLGLWRRNEVSGEEESHLLGNLPPKCYHARN
jgi:hypothetical protein